MSNDFPRMDTRKNPFSSGPSERKAQPHQITGLMVLGFMIAFFAIIVGVNASMQFARPTDRRLDRTVAVHQTGPGHFVGTADLAAGQWDLVIELSREDERIFRSKNRVILK